MAGVESQSSSVSIVEYNVDVESEPDEATGTSTTRRHNDGAKRRRNMTKNQNRDWLDDADIFEQTVKKPYQEPRGTKQLNGHFGEKGQRTVATSKHGGDDNEVIVVDSKVSSSSREEAAHPDLESSDSIDADAEAIADMLELKHLRNIKRRLKKVRHNPDRMDIVTSQLLEENDDDICEIVSAEDGDETLDRLKKRDAEMACDIVDVENPKSKDKMESRRRRRLEKSEIEEIDEESEPVRKKVKGGIADEDRCTAEAVKAPDSEAKNNKEEATLAQGKPGRSQDDEESSKVHRDRGQKGRVVHESDEEEDVTWKMRRDIKLVATRLKRKQPELKFDANTAYLLLESNLNKWNRVDVVVRAMMSTGESLEQSDSQDGFRSYNSSLESNHRGKTSVLDRNAIKRSDKRLKAREDLVESGASSGAETDKTDDWLCASKNSEKDERTNKYDKATRHDGDQSATGATEVDDTDIERESNTPGKTLPQKDAEVLELYSDNDSDKETQISDNRSGKSKLADVLEGFRKKRLEYYSESQTNTQDEETLEQAEEVAEDTSDVLDIEKEPETDQGQNAGEEDVAAEESQASVTDELGDILEEVGYVTGRFPDADGNRVYALLECRRSDPDRVQAVVDILKENHADAKNGAPALSRTTPGSATTASDPLDADVARIAAIFPDADRKRIRELCERHRDSKDRVQVITDELLKGDSVEDDIVEVPADSSVSAKRGSSRKCFNGSGSEDVTLIADDSATAQASTSGRAVALSPLEELHHQVEQMKAIFPDCDPDYLYYTLECRFADPNRVEHLLAEMFEKRNYPKLKDRLEQEKKRANVQRIKKMEFRLEEFLQLFPDPVPHFHDTTKPVTDTYKEHVRSYLLNTFPMMHVAHIDRALATHKSHLTPVLRQLEQDAQAHAQTEVGRGRGRRRGRGGRRGGNKYVFRKVPRTDESPMPEEPDEYFYKELMFTHHEQTIKDHLAAVSAEKAARLIAARDAGELHECTCCYDDEVLFEDMSACPDGHLYCNECLRRSAESAIGEGKVHFQCFEEKCELEFSTASVQKVLSPKLFSTLLRKIQEEEIRRADIPDLVSCPFCSFATIIPDDDPDKVFRCMNPECLKESCRLCKEPNHIPLRCNEVEKQGETDMRTFIESKISEAMIRTCWKCKKRFFKTEGCNKMTCPCGATMCYVCQKPKIDYNHFGTGERQCPQDTDVRKLHLEEMEKAGKLAREKYENEHPEMTGQKLKHDPMKDIKKGKKSQPAAAPDRGWVGALFGLGAGGDYNEEDDDDYDEDGYSDDQMEGSASDSEEEGEVYPAW